MIAVETSAKIGKCLKSPQVELRSDYDNDDDNDDDDDGDEDVDINNADTDDDENKADVNLIKNANNTITHKMLKANSGWADAMQKILKTKKPKRMKTLVLCKAKKLCDVAKKENESTSFEVVSKKDDEKLETSISNKVLEKVALQQKLRKKNINLGIRVKPSITDREYEKTLQRIATKGVVQLFNAVKEQQCEIKEKLTHAGPLERKREQVFREIDKSTFLDVLMSGTKSCSVDNNKKYEEKGKDKINYMEQDKVWNVLRDDFVMGAKLKDWDKNNAEDENSSVLEDMNSDS